ncbi:MAG: hypothetical protein ABI548_24990 [Polyangiaceae bacterium]
MPRSPIVGVRVLLGVARLDDPGRTQASDPMTSSLRVLMNPPPAPQCGTVPAVVRGQLRLTNRGSGKSLATTAAQPASLSGT